jgi:predicted acylesterase/phospholipase RssA
MAAPAKSIEIGLVLQGGGALGAYECGAVAALLELMEEAQAGGRMVALKAVTGVSIGAINAACVVGARDFSDARRRLNELWDDLTLYSPAFWPHEVQRDLSLFGLPGFYKPRLDYLTFAQWTSLYDTSPLLATLTKHIDFALLNASKTVFVVSAVDVESGELTRFSNRPYPRAPATTITPGHVMASGSLPPQFPWTEIKGRHYWDGGLVNNAPLGDAIAAFSHGKDVDRILVVMDLYPLRGRLPRSLAEVEDRTHELSFGNRLRQDHQVADQINELIRTIEELAPLVPASDMTPALQEQVERAREYKLVTVVDVDMQTRLHDGRPGAEDPTDDKDGLRDFSAATVACRRERGHANAYNSLFPIFLERGLVTATMDRRAAPVGS